ncbi:MAG: FtsX-like permease family protein [Lachnospiraceae bacterium]|nr:FtsX-like permease family protein [Lachnospiraceae bacterium]
MLKILKRYSIVGVLIVLCFFSAFIALCNGLLSTIQASNLIQKENQYAYSNEVQATIRITGEITLDMLVQLMNNVNTCNIYVENMEIYFEQIDSIYRPDILLQQNEILSLPTSKTVSAIPAGYIIAASSNVVGKEELSIHGKTFSIYDQMNTDEFPFITGLFVLNAKDYFEAFSEVLRDMKEITLRIASSKDDVHSAYSQIQTNTQALLPEAKIYNSNLVSTGSIYQGMLSQENVISIGLFLFALINTIIISYYWVVVRRQEIAIRKAFGANDFSVISLMTGELLKLIGLSAFFALAVQGLVWAVQGNSMDIQDSIVVITVLLLSITVAVIIAMIVPVHYILQIQPSEGVKQ